MFLYAEMFWVITDQTDAALGGKIVVLAYLRTLIHHFTLICHLERSICRDVILGATAFSSLPIASFITDALGVIFLFCLCKCRVLGS